MQRKLIVRDQLKKHGLFAYLVRLLRGQEDRSLTKEVVLEHLAMLLPNEKPEKIFSTIVNWGRFAELFGYNKDEDRFYLDQEYPIPAVPERHETDNWRCSNGCAC